MGAIDGMDLGTFGLWSSDFEFQPALQIRDSVQELEDIGWQAIWIPESLGREALSHAGYLLASTQQMAVINGVAQIWSREARWTHGASLLLADAYPDRHILGLGVSGGSRTGSKPMAELAAYLDQLDASTSPNPAPARPVRRILAAYGPKMVQMARERSLGAHTYKVNVQHTQQSREILGAEPFLGVEQAVLLETDPQVARAVAREHLSVYLNTPFNVAKFRRLGYSEDDIIDGGSDRIVDDLVYWGDVDSVTARLQGHIEAGADHVGVHVIGIEPGKSAMYQWRLLADALRR